MFFRTKEFVEMPFSKEHKVANDQQRPFIAEYFNAIIEGAIRSHTVKFRTTCKYKVVCFIFVAACVLQVVNILINMNRVVVTGMGALTPIGNDVPTYIKN